MPSIRLRAELEQGAICIAAFSFIMHLFDMTTHEESQPVGETHDTSLPRIRVSVHAPCSTVHLSTRALI